MSTLTETDVDLESMLIVDEEPEEGMVVHIVNPPKNLHIWKPGMTAKEMVSIAKMTSQYLIALCGVKFWPKYKHENLDVCQGCMDVAGVLMSEAGE